MNTQAQTPSGSSSQIAFDFVKELAAELSTGKVDMPGFPDIALRVRKALADEEVSAEKLVRVVGSEPLLATQLLRIANSAAVNVSGRSITDLRTAVARMGFNMVRTAAITFAVSQLKKADALKGLEQPLDELWNRSAEVAAMSHVVARRLTRVNPDTALLAGLLHGIGHLYILARAGRHPALFNDQAAYHAIIRDWHASIAKALLENWEMADEIIHAVGEFEDLQRQHIGPPDLCDVLTVAHLLVSYRNFPDTIELNMEGVAACQRLKMNKVGYDALLTESADDINDLKAALGV